MVPKVRASPLIPLFAVTGAIYANQVLVAIYVHRVWNGDVTPVAQYVPSGWFAVPDWPWLTSLAAAWPAPHLLAFSVLRFDSLVELPFGLLAYLWVGRWHSTATYRALLDPRRLWAASLVWSVTFMYVEWRLWNPYTVDDLVLRAISAVLTPLVLTRLLVRPDPEDGAAAPTVLDLARFLLALAAIAVLMLAVYDTATLYNLAHLPRALPLMIVSALTLTALARLPEPAARPAPFGVVRAAHRFLGLGLVVFFVPSLPVRYVMTFGGLLLPAATLGLLLVDLTAALVLREAPDPRAAARVVVQALAAAAVGTAAALAVPALDVVHTETRLLVSAAAFAAATLLTLVVLEGFGRRQEANP